MKIHLKFIFRIYNLEVLRHILRAYTASIFLREYSENISPEYALTTARWHSVEYDGQRA